MHHIQAKILNKMLCGSELSYAGMRPAGVESNHFAYHLEQLIKQGLVSKDGRVYHLSPTGLRTIDRLSHQNMRERLQPHIVTAIDLTAPDGETLLFTRHFQPFLQMTGFPLGKLHYDETVAAAAVRELHEKTGLVDVPLTQRGMIYIDARRDGITVSKVLYHIFHGDAPGPLPVAVPAHRGDVAWADHTTYEPTQLMPGFLRIKELLAASTGSGLFFDEITENF